MRIIGTWLVAASLLLAGCTPAAIPPATEAPVVTTPVVNGGATATVDTGIGAIAIDKIAVPAAQGLVIGELAYNSAAETALLLTQKGLIRGTTAAQVRTLNQQATLALGFAYSATTQVERARQIAKLYDAIGGLDAITKPLKGLLGTGK